MTFDDYILKQDHIEIQYYIYSGKTDKRVFTLDGVDLKGVLSISYYKYDAEKDKLLYHREDGPALIRYDHYKICETSYLYGKIHSLKGPAIVKYDRNGIIINTEFRINDLRVKKKDFLKLKNKL